MLSDPNGSASLAGRGNSPQQAFDRLNEASVALLEVWLDPQLQQDSRDLANALSRRVEHCASVAHSIGLAGIERLASILLPYLRARALDEDVNWAPEQVEAWVGDFVSFCAAHLVDTDVEGLVFSMLDWPEFPVPGGDIVDSLLRELLEDAIRIEDFAHGESHSLRAGADEFELLAQESDSLADEIAVLRREPGVRWTPNGGDGTDDLPDSVHVLESATSSLEAIGRAAAAIGALGMVAAIERAVCAIKSWLRDPDHLPVDSLPLLGEFPRRLAAYLRAPDRARATALAALLSEPGWPEPLAADETESLVARLADVDIVRSRRLTSLMPTVTLKDLSLALPADIEPELAEQMLLELPQLSESLRACLEQVRDGDHEAVAQALRIAHTLKGVANTAQLHAVATIAHLLEELLQTIAESGQRPAPGLGDPLTLAAESLDRMTGAVVAAYQASSDAVGVCSVLQAWIGRLLTDDAASDEEHWGSISVSSAQPQADVAPVRALFAPDRSDVQARQLQRAQAIGKESEALLAELRARLDCADSSAIAPGEPVNALLERLESLAAGLESLTDEVTKAPVSTISARMHRVVDQAARQADRMVELHIEGEHLEVDARLLGELVEPLSQMLRNAVDHGIEPETERIADGKPAQGAVTLSFERSAGKLLIRCADDGRGLDTEAIQAKALAADLLKPGEALDPELVVRLLTRQGFTTRKLATQLSGRGIGLDIVERIASARAGRISVESLSGRGTEWLIEIPD